MSKKYKDILQNTVIPDGDYDKNVNVCNDLLEYIDSYLPKKLYRYRSISERNLTAFLNDELWFSNGGVMNDDFDSRLFYNQEKIRTELDLLISETGGLKPIDSILCMESIPEYFNQIIPNATEEFSRLKSLDKKEIDSISKSIIGYIYNNMDSELSFLTDFIQQSSKFACFTPDITSNTMWGQYADCSKGFALEYIFDKQTNICSNKEYINEITCQLFPMEYYVRRLDATEFAVYLLQVTILHKLSIAKGIVFSKEMRNIIIPCPDSFMFTKISLAKSIEWKREKEWRLFLFF